MITARIIDIDGKEKWSATAEAVDEIYSGGFSQGDRIVIDSPDVKHMHLKLDKMAQDSIVYCPDGHFELLVPTGEELRAYYPTSFTTSDHWIKVKEVSEEEFYSYRRISLNGHDTEISTSYPHATSNAVSANPALRPRNAIDGIICNSRHGDFPANSWSGGKSEDIEYHLDFGAEVEIDKIDFFIRAHFPHDTYWKSLDVELSDGSRIPVQLDKTAAAQTLKLDNKKTTFVHLTNFKQAANPLSFAAFSQIEVYGRYIKK